MPTHVDIQYMYYSGKKILISNYLSAKCEKKLSGAWHICWWKNNWMDFANTSCSCCCHLHQGAHRGIAPASLVPSKRATLSAACKDRELTQRIMCYKIKRDEKLKLWLWGTIVSMDNGKATLAGNLTLQSLQFYVLMRDRALLVL